MDYKNIFRKEAEMFVALFLMLIETLKENVWALALSFEPKDERLYKAAFSNEREFLDAGNGGVFINGVAATSCKTSYEGTLITGPTGSGKGVSIIVPNLLLTPKDRSVICHDPSGETTQLVSGLLSETHRIIIIRCFDPKHSHFYNPLTAATTKAARYKVAYVLVNCRFGGDQKDPFWSLQSVTVIYCFVSIVMTQEPVFRNLYNVRKLIVDFVADPRKVDPLFIRHADDDLMQTYRSINTMDDKVLKSVVATCLAALSLWDNDPVVRITSGESSCDFESIRKVPTAVFVQNRTGDTELYRPLLELFFQQATDAFFAKLPSTDDLDVMMLVDEASSIQLKGSLNAYLNNSRKHRVAWVLAFQSQQIESIYGSEAASIKAALRTKVWLAGAGLETSKELEELLGRTEVVDANGRSKVVPLMTAEDIRSMPSDQAIVIAPSGRAYKTTCLPYFRNPYLRSKAACSPFSFVNEKVPVNIPTIPLRAPDKSK